MTSKNHMKLERKVKPLTILDRYSEKPVSRAVFAWDGVVEFDKQILERWLISPDPNMFQYFGGSAVMLVPDNLKTGVDHAGDWYTPQINRTYRELAEHYNTAVVPARVRKPKDKSGAEGTVGVVSTRIIAALRNRKFFSLEELNRAVRQKLDEQEVILKSNKTI